MEQIKEKEQYVIEGLDDPYLAYSMKGTANAMHDMIALESRREKLSSEEFNLTLKAIGRDLDKYFSEAGLRDFTPSL